MYRLVFPSQQVESHILRHLLEGATARHYQALEMDNPYPVWCVPPPQTGQMSFPFHHLSQNISIWLCVNMLLLLPSQVQRRVRGRDPGWRRNLGGRHGEGGLRSPQLDGVTSESNVNRGQDRASSTPALREGEWGRQTGGEGGGPGLAAHAPSQRTRPLQECSCRSNDRPVLV